MDEMKELMSGEEPIDIASGRLNAIKPKNIDCKKYYFLTDY